MSIAIKYRLLAIIHIIPILITSCDKSPKVYRDRVTLIDVLPVYVAPAHGDKLIDDCEMGEIVLCNNISDVERAASTEFIETFPEYRQIDFDRYTLLVRTDWLAFEVKNRQISLWKEMGDGSLHLNVAYETGATLDSLWHERISVVIDKVPSGTTVSYSYSVSSGSNVTLPIRY